MSDLISRQAAIDALHMHLMYRMGTDSNKKRLDDWINGVPSVQPGITLESAIDYLHSIGWMQAHDRTLTESAQPERKKGKWKETDDGWDGTYYVCSECGCPWTLIDGTPEDNGMNFCPNCGSFNGGVE